MTYLILDQHEDLDDQHSCTKNLTSMVIIYEEGDLPVSDLVSGWKRLCPSTVCSLLTFLSAEDRGGQVEANASWVLTHVHSTDRTLAIWI